MRQTDGDIPLRRCRTDQCSGYQDKYDRANQAPHVVLSLVALVQPSPGRPGLTRGQTSALAPGSILRQTAGMTRTILIYAVVMAGAAFLLEWLEFRHLTHAYSAEIYIVLIAVGFTVLGAWVGYQLTRRRVAAGFELNTAALKSLGVSAREHEVLSLLADGQSNKEIARSLEISPNTVKTHLANLYEKLSVQRRTQAIQKARELALIP